MRSCWKKDNATRSSGSSEWVFIL